MMAENHPYRQLRQEIRRSAKQFRKEVNPKQRPIFNSESSYEYAYIISDVEEALDRYELTLPQRQQTTPADASMETQIADMAEDIVNFSQSMEARDFARTVLAYFAIAENRRNTPWPTLEVVKSTNQE